MSDEYTMRFYNGGAGPEDYEAPEPPRGLDNCENCGRRHRVTTTKCRHCGWSFAGPGKVETGPVLF